MTDVHVDAPQVAQTQLVVGRGGDYGRVGVQAKRVGQLLRDQVVAHLASHADHDDVGAGRYGQRLHFWDIPSLWWNPPDRWPAGQPISIDISDIPVRQFLSWQATASQP